MTTAVAVATMKAAHVTTAGVGLEIVLSEIPDPDPGFVRINVQTGSECDRDSIVVVEEEPR